MRNCFESCTAVAMDRCACHGTSFEDVASLQRILDLPFRDLLRVAEMGQTCTACHGDLRDYLSGLGLAAPSDPA